MVQMTATASFNPQVADILSRFPQPAILYPSIKKWTGYTIGSALFVAIGYYFLDNSALAWFSFIFFCFCTIVFTIQLLPGSSSLTLDADGFETRAFFFRRIRSRWQNVTNIKAASGLPPASARVKIIWYNDDQWKRWWFARQETAIFGYNTCLPDTYGLPAEELADLMTRWQERALALAKQPRPVHPRRAD
jgi:hypothetical protein